MTARARHVWVRPEHSPTECAGLVLEWRRTPDWEALVTYVEPRGRAVTEWVAADQLRPAADAGRNRGSADG